jgi:mannose-6-phosphate isomerase-like protein (cupin superfamily)
MGRQAGGPVEPREPYRTLDGSMVTELVRPERGGSRNVSVAEAVIEPGQTTRAHKHVASDEVYYVLSGKGSVQVGGNSASVTGGSCVLIPAGQTHRATCDGDQLLRMLCICSPPYSHEGTTPAD